MRLVLFFALIVFLHVTSYSQKAVVTNDHRLLMPTDSLNKAHLLSKLELRNVESIGSSLGEVISYDISFQQEGSLFTKNNISHSLDSNVLKILMTLVPNTKIYFDHIVIKRNTTTIHNNGSCSFILVD